MGVGPFTKVSNKMASQAPKKICLVGSGNWGSAIASIIGKNSAKFNDTFQPEICMYVYEEEVEWKGAQRKLSQVINEEHENVKYLPGMKSLGS